MSRLRRAALATLVVQLFSVIATGLSFITIPLYLAWLGSERYGLMLTAQACAGYLAFSDAGLSWSSLLLISHAKGRDDRAEIAHVVRNSLALAAVSGLVVGTVTLAFCVLLRFRFAFLPLPGSNPESPGLAVAIGLQVIVALASSPVYNIFFGLQESSTATIYQGMGRVLGVAVSLLAAARGASIGGVVAAGVIGPLLCALACAAHVWRRHPWVFARGSFWDRRQIRLQYRTGAKSLGLQIGRTLVGSAPVIAISSQAGAQFVPAFTIALTLINLPLNAVSYFNAMLQSGYGEAVSKQDYPWVRATVSAIVRNILLLQGLLAAGFLPLAGPAIAFWTHGKLHASGPVLVSALLVGLLTSLTGALQFALSGANRHKVAGAAELLNGLCCLTLSALVVRYAGYEWVGWGILAATALTSGWLLPIQIKRHLGVERLLPAGSFLLCLLAACALAGGAGWAVVRTGAADGWNTPAALAAAGMLVVAVYLVVWRTFSPESVKPLIDRLLWRRQRRPVSGAAANIRES